jgi:16S rRNA (guanine(1405)-N(7))-methyltransferase
MEDAINNAKKNILKKKDLRGLSAEFLDEFIEEYKNKHLKEFKVLEQKGFNEKSKEYDELKKSVRKKLREVHGAFTKKPLGEEKKRLLLLELAQAKREENLEKEKQTVMKILKSHASTCERKDSYNELYLRILKNQPVKKILDLGCGYNPFAYTLFKEQVRSTQDEPCGNLKSEGKKTEYVAVDINNRDLKFIQKYFALEKIRGKTLNLDLTEEKNLKIIEKESENATCFMFKLLDSLEAKKKKSSEALLKHIKSPLIIISFPLKTIGGRKRIVGKRKWFQKLLRNKNYKITEETIGNEKYYIINTTA